MKKYPLTNLYAVLIMGLVMGLGHLFELTTLQSLVAGVVAYLVVIGYFLSQREIYRSMFKEAK